MGSATAFGSANLRGYTSIPADAPLERKIDYLLARDQDAQERMHAVAKDLRELRSKIEADDAALHEIVSAERDAAIREALAEYRGLKTTGAFSLVLGFVLVLGATIWQWS